MKLISESCFGGQRASLKLKLWSTTPVCFIATYVSLQTKREYFASLLHVSPKCNISRPMDFLEFFNVYCV